MIPDRPDESMLEAELRDEMRGDDEDAARVACAACRGARLNATARAVRVLDVTIEELMLLSVAELAEAVAGFRFAGRDAVIAREIPDVRKAMKWNTPFYGAGAPDQGWFLSFHAFDRYVKVTFFQGAALQPPPEGRSKYPQVRYYDVP